MNYRYLFLVVPVISFWGFFCSRFSCLSRYLSCYMCNQRATKYNEQYIYQVTICMHLHIIHSRPICLRRRSFTNFFTPKHFFHFRKLPNSVFDLMNSSIIQHYSNASLLDVSVYLDFMSFDMTSFRQTILKILAFFVSVPCFGSMFRFHVSFNEL